MRGGGVGEEGREKGLEGGEALGTEEKNEGRGGEVSELGNEQGRTRTEKNNGLDRWARGTHVSDREAYRARLSMWEEIEAVEDATEVVSEEREDRKSAGVRMTAECEVEVEEVRRSRAAVRESEEGVR